jgi:hypothetical protein
MNMFGVPKYTINSHPLDSSVVNWVGWGFGFGNRPAGWDFPGHSRRLSRKHFWYWCAKCFWDWAIPFCWTN